MALWSFGRWLKDNEDRRFMILSLLSAWGAAFSHPFGLWVIIMQSLFVLTVPSVRSLIGKKYLYYLIIWSIGYMKQALITASIFTSGLENPYGAKSNIYTFLYFIKIFLNGNQFHDFTINSIKDNYISALFLALLPLALIRAYFLNLNFHIVLLNFYMSVLMLLSHFIFSSHRSSLMDRYLMPASIPILVLVVTCLMCYPFVPRLILGAGFLYHYLSNATPQPAFTGGVDELIACVNEVNPDKRFPLFIQPSWEAPQILYYYNPEVFFDLSPPSLDRITDMMLSGIRSRIWIMNYYDPEYVPPWLNQVDTFVVATSNKNFLRSLEVDFHVEEPKCEGSCVYVTRIYRRRNDRPG